MEGGDLSALAGLLSLLGEGDAPPRTAQAPSVSPLSELSEGRVLSIMQSALSAFGRDSKGDARAALLYALRPFLSPARAARVDGAVRIMRLADVARVAIFGEEVKGCADRH